MARPNHRRVVDAGRSLVDSDLLSYEDGDATVVCDRKNAKAWVRSDHLVPVER